MMVSIAKILTSNILGNIYTVKEKMVKIFYNNRCSANMEEEKANFSNLYTGERSLEHKEVN